jgi:hypothetical protein
MSGRTRVRIVGDHPHRGASGTVRDDLPQAHGMWKVELDVTCPKCGATVVCSTVRSGGSEVARRYYCLSILCVHFAEPIDEADVVRADTGSGR